MEPCDLQLIEGVLSEELCSTACTYLRLKADIGEMTLGDSHVPNALFSYGDLLMDVILQRVQPVIEEATGTTLLPTHSYARIYRRGNELSPHKDRPACEFSVTVTLGHAMAEPWPIFVRAHEGPRQYVLKAGNGLIYPGADVDHWREPLTGEWQAQLTLHYVNKNGPHAGWVFDKRPGLGWHSGTRRA